MDTLVAVAPFISTYFVHFLAKTNLKKLVLLINSIEYNPEYVDNAVNMLKTSKFAVHVRKRPKESKFMHLKVMIPYILHKGSLTPFCAMSGSVNFTKNGISISDEALFVFRDMYNINALIVTYDTLLDGSIMVYDSSKPDAVTGKRMAVKKPAARQKAR
jgi:hypothetical protein